MMFVTLASTMKFGMLDFGTICTNIINDHFKGHLAHGEESVALYCIVLYMGFVSHVYGGVFHPNNWNCVVIVLTLSFISETVLSTQTIHGILCILILY
jgi:hypothetical protein